MSQVAAPQWPEAFGDIHPINDTGPRSSGWRGCPVLSGKQGQDGIVEAKVPHGFGEEVPFLKVVVGV